MTWREKAGRRCLSLIIANGKEAGLLGAAVQQNSLAISGLRCAVLLRRGSHGLNEATVAINIFIVIDLQGRSCNLSPINQNTSAFPTAYETAASDGRAASLV